MHKLTVKAGVALLGATIFFNMASLRAGASNDALITHHDFSYASTDKIFADYKATAPDAAAKIPGSIIKTEGGETVFSVAGQKGIFSSDFMPVNTANTYELSGKFKSIGVADPLLYYGIASYDANKNIIRAQHVYRNGNDATITAYTDNQITVSETLTDWYQPPYPAWYRSIGIYYDGDTTKLPDYLWLNYGANPASVEPGSGTYSTATGNTISINQPIPADVKAKIIPGTTVVKNHTSGGTYIYFASGGNKVPANWTNYSGKITGESFNQSIVAFRPGTKYVKVLFLLNYANVAGQETVFDNILFRELKTGKELIDQTNNNNNGSIYGDLSFGAGKSGESGIFDGDDYVSVANSATLQDISQDFSWSFWMKASDQTAAEAKLIDFGNTTIRLGTMTGQKIKAWIKTDSISNAVLSDENINDGEWHHVALTWDGAIIKMYVDGNQQALTIPKSGTLAVDGNLTIGGDAAGNNFIGTLDEIQIFNYALSVDEIKTLSQHVEETPVELFWAMVEDFLFHQGNVHIVGNLKLDGNIVSDGEICLGKCV